MNKRILFIIFSWVFGLMLCACTYTTTTKSIYDINLSIEKNDINDVQKSIENINLNTVYYNESCDDGEEDDGEWYGCLAPLETATMFNRYEIAKLLIDHGADVNYKDKYVHYTPLSILFRYNNMHEKFDNI